ncbi:sugar nucleotide-binding protein [Microbacterium sp. UFMG61]|uniref:sugar nucleotide-binding protein n=1 Tax=Microbacterium sp. UFMG61 TaxID=2745935 RepID=UPI00188EDC73|nr:sugar nucleotide-binding protein [Microbacterium sp. UFMG61]
MASSWGRDEREPGRTLLVGCGKIGVRLGERILAGGGEVTAIRRNAAGLPTGFRTIAADLEKPLAQELPEFDSVVITLPPSRADSERGSIYPLALPAIADALPSMPSRVVFVSSTRVFEGRPGPDPLTEQDAPATTSAGGAALVEGEDLARELLGATVVRPAGIYGPGRDSLIRRVRAGDAIDATRRTNRIHETDVVRLLEVLLRAAAPPALVHGVDREPVALGDVAAFIAAELGVATPPALDPPVGGGTVLDGSLLLALLGELEYPTFREGYAEMVAQR